jgi:hypothetical protein
MIQLSRVVFSHAGRESISIHAVKQNIELLMNGLIVNPTILAGRMRRRLTTLPWSSDRNPDELVWKHLKADTAGRMAVTSKDDFKTKVRSSMRQASKQPGKNLLLLPKTFPQIRRVNVWLFINWLKDFGREPAARSTLGRQFSAEIRESVRRK